MACVVKNQRAAVQHRIDFLLRLWNSKPVLEDALKTLGINFINVDLRVVAASNEFSDLIDVLNV